MPWPLPVHPNFPMDRLTPQLSAEGYGEPQTRPANQAGQNEDLQEFSTGRNLRNRRVARYVVPRTVRERTLYSAPDRAL